MSFDSLVLSGGAFYGILQLGALAYLYEKNYHTNIKAYFGTSIGSAIGCLLNCGYTPIELFMIVYSTSSFMDIPSVNINLISNFTTNYGYTTLTKLMDIVSAKITLKFGCVPNLKDLYELTGKELVISTVCLNTGKCIYMDHKSHPNECVVNAIKKSCNIPLLFNSHEENYGDYYVDGGLCDNFPMLECISRGYTSPIGLKVNMMSDYKQISNIFDYIMCTIFTIQKAAADINKRLLDILSEKCNYKIIYLKSSKQYNILKVSADTVIKMNLYNDGYTICKNSFN